MNAGIAVGVEHHVQPSPMRRRWAAGAWRIGAAEARRVARNRGGLMVSGVFLLIVAGMLSTLWSAAADAAGGAIAGYSGAALVWYVTTSEIATISQRMQFIDELGDDIGTGRVDMALLRPMPLVLAVWAAQIGGMMPRLAVCVAGGVPLALLIAGAPPSPSALAIAAPALVLGVVVNITAQHVFASVAFWARNARATWFLYQKFVFVIGGMLLPLEVLPGWLEAAARWLPFMAMAYVPGRLASGAFEPELLLLQLFWLGVVGAAAAWLFALGERHLTSGTR